ncbi:MAG: TIGR02221 family CRISPR-associated protein [Gammaproteobacteria bacterium]|nr:TIGR02221 family CRISPR-associated protein [Gammaproteobacteria bacterium]MBT4605620.1 TIGR02221 family CRISPR-associated protein [Thiotrichales bacterium]MBT5746584.1 TIGR02221 family CRISPR-associated protein [Gammaproteobacteria bacterium]MBT6079978.1 TIGR02221 family CRISPR-associated protein [Gammaproteobacteria bacterium]MBT7828633.1 TIGR02221 family CRISPR-associated protein [Candidatus Neomarinimicrobiota bacterium]
MRTLVTFLGRTPRQVKEDSYRETQYDFGGGELTSPVAFFGWVLMQRLVENSGLDRVVILGTSGSMWDHLFEQDIQLGDTHEDLRLSLVDAVENKEVTQRHLDQLAPVLKEHVGMEMVLHIIPYCQGESEQVELLRIMDDLVEEGEQIELDVTHGFRHLPMLGLMAALFLRSVRGVVVNSIWYGAYDQETGVAPVHDLVGLLKIADWMQGLVSYDKDGDYSVFSKLLGGGRGELLAEAAYFERVSNNSVASQRLGSWMGLDERVDPNDPAAVLFQPILEERLQWHKKSPQSQQEQSLAWVYLQKRDFVRAVIYGMEGLITADCEHGSDPHNHDSREEAKEHLRDTETGFITLGQIRNTLAHGNPPKEKVKRIIGSEKKLANTLRSLFKQLNVRQ